jgi:hypothetical protein
LETFAVIIDLGSVKAHGYNKVKFFIPILDAEDSWNHAKEICISEETELASLLNEQEATSAIYVIRNKAKNDTFWVGLKNNGTSLQWLNGAELSDNVSYMLTGKNVSQLQQESASMNEHCFYLTKNGSLVPSFCLAYSGIVPMPLCQDYFTRKSLHEISQI